MKETIRTLISRSGEAADLAFEDYENDGQRELLMNAYWEKVAEDNSELLDVVDKKNVGSTEGEDRGSHPMAFATSTV